MYVYVCVCVCVCVYVCVCLVTVTKKNPFEELIALLSDPTGHHYFTKYYKTHYHSSKLFAYVMLQGMMYDI